MRLDQLFEARRNPELNFDGRLNDRRSSAFGYLSQFKPISGDDPTYFVTFTEIPKVGINPQSKYQTPIGIYTYPIVPQIIMGHSKKELPFAGEEKYISVVQAAVHGDKVCMFDDHDTYGPNYERDHGKLLSFLEGGYDGDDCKGFLQAAGEAAYEPQDPASRIWNESRWVAGAEAMMRTGTVTYGLNEIQQRMIDGRDVAGLPVNWNYVLRKVLGYELVIDMDQGIIHANEPLQALFLSKDALQLIDQRQNQHSAGRGPQHVTTLWHVAPSTRFELLVQLVRNTVENHSNPLIAPGSEMRSIANDLNRTLSKFTFTRPEIENALKHLEIEQLIDMLELP